MRSAIFVGFFVVAFLITMNFIIAKGIGKLFERMMLHKDHRIELTSDVINGIK